MIFGLVMLTSPELEAAVRDLVAVHTHGATDVEHHIRQQARGVDTKTWIKAGVAAVAMPTHEVAAHHHGQEEEGGCSPLAIIMGALIGGVPESVVLGAAYTTFSALCTTLLVAVFMANLPEAMSSCAQLVRAKYTPEGRIFSLWLPLVLASEIPAMVGNIFLASASGEVVVFVAALAYGGIVWMLAPTMMPEAFEEGGAPVLLATITGFLAALVFTTIGMAHCRDRPFPAE
jgi:zinc transporter ZupT